MKTTVILITHNSKKHLKKCLPPILSSSIRPHVLLVNSSSEDGTVEEARDYGIDTLIVPRIEFNHGATRELARKKAGGDIVIFMTPDAYLASTDSLEKLLDPIITKKAECSYARQLPHRGAKQIESFQRAFNYPEHGHIRTLADVKQFGIYTFFCSNSCAAYLNQALDQIGGFSQVLLGEDTVASAKMLRQGMRIAYAADSLVYHSHTYSIKQEFQRAFDTGLARASYKSLLKSESSDEDLGKKYASRLFFTFLKKHPLQIPYAALHTAAKALGYLIGKKSLNRSIAFKKRFTSQDFFFESIYKDCLTNEANYFH